MNDLLLTLGITFLLFLVIVTVLGIWILWSTNEERNPVTWDEQDRLMAEIERLKREEQELRWKVDREFDRDREWNQAINQARNYTWSDFQNDQMKALRNDRTRG